MKLELISAEDKETAKVILKAIFLFRPTNTKNLPRWVELMGVMIIWAGLILFVLLIIGHGRIEWLEYEKKII